MTRPMCRRCRDATRGPGAVPANRPSAPSARAPGKREARNQTSCAVRRRPNLAPRVRQVVLHGRVRQAQAVRGRLLRPGDQDGGDHADLAVGGPCGGAGRPSRHALRSQSKGSGGSASRMVTGRSVVAGLRLSPRPVRQLRPPAGRRGPESCLGSFPSRASRQASMSPSPVGMMVFVIDTRRRLRDTKGVPGRVTP